MVKFHHKNQLNFYLVVNTSRFKALNNDLTTRFWCDAVIKSCIPFRWQWFDYGALKLNTTVLLLCASMKTIDKLLGVPLTKLLIFYILFAMIIDWNKCVMLLGTLTKKGVIVFSRVVTSSFIWHLNTFKISKADWSALSNLVVFLWHKVMRFCM